MTRRCRAELRKFWRPALKWCADRMDITEKLEAIGIKVVYVGSIISDLLKEGWPSLTF